MSEIPAPYGPHHKKSDPERIAQFMTGFLGVEMLYDIPCPEKFTCDYEDMTPDEQNEWFEYTFLEVFKDAAYQAVGLLGRELKVVELNLIRRRILNYLNDNGFEYGKR